MLRSSFTCQVLLNCVKGLQKRSLKCLGQTGVRVVILYFLIGRSTRRWNLASYEVLPNSIQQLQRRSREYMSKSIRGQASVLVFRAPQNTNLVEGVEILLPFRFRRIPSSSCRRRLKNVLVNQRPGRKSWFSDRPQKTTNLVEDIATLLPVNSIQQFQIRRQKCLSQ